MTTKKGMFYKDKRASIIQKPGINDITLGGRYGVTINGNLRQIKSFYSKKAVAKFEEIFFISCNHTGMISREDALNNKMQDKQSLIVMDGLSYRLKGHNSQLI